MKKLFFLNFKIFLPVISRAIARSYLLKNNVSSCITAFAMTLLLISCGDTANRALKEYNQGINIIPKPQNLVLNKGSFRLNEKTSFYASTPASRTIASFFAAKIQNATGYSMNVSDSEVAKNVILLQIETSLDVNDEGYTLEVTPSAVVVKAKAPQGLFYGMQSFMQLLPAEIESPTLVTGIPWIASCVAVQD